MPPTDHVVEPTPSRFGPVNRVTFFAEQARHRRSAGRYLVLCALAVLAAGLPLTIVVTPVLYTLLLALITVARLVTPIPEPVWAAAGSLPHLLITLGESLDRPGQPAPWGLVLTIIAALAIPAVAAMGLVWLLLWRLFKRCGVGGILLGLGAREPRAGDFEEQQLVNVVAEMAIAAGLPPPRVVLLDGLAANAAVVGSGPDDATIVVARRLLDELNRDATQGIIGHLIATIGHGDLRIALAIVTVLRTFGLVTTLLDATVSPTARALLGRLVRLSLSRHRDGSAQEANLVARLLVEHADRVDQEDVDQVLGAAAPPFRRFSLTDWWLRIRVFGLFPLWAAAGMAKVALMILTDFALTPLIAVAWRARRYLADAATVQLTRNPDGLAAGLHALAERGGLAPHATWASHLFIVGQSASASTAFAQRLQAARQGSPTEVAANLAAEIRSGRLAELAAAAQPAAPELVGRGGPVNFHPPLDRRLGRLRALGATLDLAALAAGSRSRPPWLANSLGLSIAPLLVLVAGLMLVALTLLIGLISLFMLIYFLLVYLIFALINGRAF